MKYLLITLLICAGCTSNLHAVRVGDCFESVGDVYRVTKEGNFSFDSIDRNGTRFLFWDKSKRYRLVDCFDYFDSLEKSVK